MQRSIRGYILLESLVALAILGILVVIFTVSISQEQRLIQDTKNFTMAHARANAIMEISKDIPFHELKSYSLSSVPDLPEGQGEVEVSDFNTLELKKIVVTVSWRGSGGKMQKVSLSTLRANR
jgi:prepilin-type N-terminal cleavage/methylation domain-containing protein